VEEINEIFTKAQNRLVDAIEQIREEEKNASIRMNNATSLLASTEYEDRLLEAKESVSRSFENVKKETQEVKNAMMELQRLQNELDSDPMTKIANLKDAGFVKQAAFVGMILF